MLSRPLVVDLDGTLLNSDMLLETGLAYLRQYPLYFYRPFLWLLKGKAHLKSKLAQATNLDVSVLPYNPDVIALIESVRKQGRRVILATASHRVLAHNIAEHLGLFDDVLASDEQCNLSAVNKQRTLVDAFGERQFDYIGNSADDLVVWRSAHSAVVVSHPDSRLVRQAQAHGNTEQVITPARVRIRHWLRALRLHQWLKNLLIIVPLLASHQITNLELLSHSILAFLLFGLCASSVYILNDLLDLADDRHHHRKRRRPFASGDLSIQRGLVAFPLLLALSFTGAILLLPWTFAVVLAGYYLLTLAYSLFLKRQMSLDVITLALLYTTRLVAGAAACQIALTSWILAFSMFIFLSLALVKRHTELLAERNKGSTTRTRGRGYYASDLEIISALGAASGYLSVMVLALYINEPTTALLYSHPHIIWLACPLMLFWISRIWILAHRGQVHDDPVVFAVRDRTSLVTGMILAGVFWLAV
ncbi:MULTISPECIES: UbiA family prenyltransferase [Pseudomonas]|uniref:UbiA family prenyltransferase n=1 Tax=Serpens gallinarum TaxID=2763075 RepID=A0ABR8TJF6_9PSED|nr:UbiA family prenyltransferase [Serpens gallinarum]MBD7975910.1 UbiA family prenyltransferase [Serpens gallinarum]